MKRRPEFTIIAGPNGASKSRLGIFYSTVKAFDGDLLAMSLQNDFSTDLPVNLVQDFKDAGYKISLIFFGLSSKEDSLSRVIQRYTMGGHNVNQDVIEYNFTEGIKRVRASLPLFENILFIDGTSDFGDIVAIHIEKSLPFWQ